MGLFKSCPGLQPDQHLKGRSRQWAFSSPAQDSLTDLSSFSFKEILIRSPWAFSSRAQDNIDRFVILLF